MTNFPKKLTPHYAKNTSKRRAKTTVSKDTMNKMLAIIREAKKLRDESIEYHNGNLSL